MKVTFGKIMFAMLLFQASLPGSATANNDKSVIEITSEKISLQLNGVSLAEVLDDISEKTGTIFKTDIVLDAEKLNKELEGESWQNIFAHLLKDYSYALEEQNEKIVKVIITASNNASKITKNSGRQQQNADIEKFTYSEQTLEGAIKPSIKVEEQANNQNNSSIKTKTNSAAKTNAGTSSNSAKSAVGTVSENGINGQTNNSKLIQSELSKETQENNFLSTRENLSSEEIKSLRSVSRAILIARREEKRNIQSEISEDIEIVKRLGRVLEKLEVAAMRESLSVKLAKPTPEKLSVIPLVNENLTEKERTNSVPADQQPAPPKNTQESANKGYSYTPEPATPSGENRKLSGASHEALQGAIDAFSSSRDHFENRSINEKRNVASYLDYVKKQGNKRFVDISTEAKEALLVMKAEENMDIDKIRSLQKAFALGENNKVQEKPQPTFQTFTKHR